MSIPPLAAPAPSPAAVSVLAALDASSLVLDALTTSGAINVGDIGGIAGSASIVDISSLGQLVSTVSAFQAAQAASGDAGRSVDDVTANAELLLGAFNDFTASNSNGVQDLLATAADDPFQTVFDVPSASNPAQTLQAALAQIGITEAGGAAGQLALNPATLDAAASADPAGTSAVLSQAFSVLGRFAATIVSQNASLQALDGDTTLPDIVPASVAGSAVAQAATLSPANAATASAALQSMLNDQAFSVAAAETLSTTQTIAEDTAAETANASAAVPAATTATTATTGATAIDQTIAADAGANPATAAVVSTIAPPDSPADPAIAAAVAAYRVSESAAGDAEMGPGQGITELVTDVAEVVHANPTTFDAGGDATQKQRIRNGKGTPAAAASSGIPPESIDNVASKRTLVDITV